MKNDEIYKLWCEFLEEYREYMMVGNELWKYKLTKTKQFIDTNKKRPSSKSENIQEKRLGQ